MDRLLAFASLAIAFALLGWFSGMRRHRRQLGVRAFARKFGFEHRPADPFGLLYDYNFPLLEMGAGRGCENVVWGEFKGMPFRATDYWFYEESRGVRTYRHLNAVIVDIPAYLPAVTVERTGILSMMTGGVGWRDLQFESEKFNRAFDVRAEQPASAFKLIDARMMHWMLSTDDIFGFQFYGSAILVWSKRLRPSELFPLIGTAKELLDHIPRLVWADYGTGPEPVAGAGS
ncbi:MAG TPA: hypothetical protein VIG64_05675 [Actinomycetota bacterium]|jgi:hypothetical protein